MGRGVSSGGGQSSLGYLFGSGELPKPTTTSISQPAPTPTEGHTENIETSHKLPPVNATQQIPAGIQSNPANNYFRADGQNTGNFITDRPSTKVHAAPGGGSSLNYLFGSKGSK